MQESKTIHSFHSNYEKCDYRVRFSCTLELIAQDVGVFDAFHAVHSNGKIISSDKIYKKLGLEQIDLSDDNPKNR